MLLLYPERAADAAVILHPVPERAGMGFEAVAPPGQPAGEFAVGGDMDARAIVEGGLVQVMHAEYIANAILYAVSQPEHVNVNEVLIRPTGQRN